MHNHEPLYLLLPRLELDQLEHLHLVVLLVPLYPAARLHLSDRPLPLVILSRPLLPEAVFSIVGGGNLGVEAELMEDPAFPEVLRAPQVKVDSCLIQGVLELDMAESRIVKLKAVEPGEVEHPEGFLDVCIHF